ncbi:MAG: hypothetical protein Q4B39_07745 [[Ruminococcus] gnavus]|nr:hypothetical protein [Mediterraneibacter gnavus]
MECENGKLLITAREPEEVEFHTPCGKCMMVAEDCKWYGKKMIMAKIIVLEP